MTYTLNRLDQQINLVNIKASLLLTTDIILFGMIITTISNLSELDRNSKVSTFLKILSGLGIVLVLISTLLAIYVIFAFLKSGNRSNEYNSLIYFGSIE